MEKNPKKIPPKHFKKNFQKKFPKKMSKKIPQKKFPQINFKKKISKKFQKIKELLCLNSYACNRGSACENLGGLGLEVWEEIENAQT
jgi:hypothetical protein